MKNDGASVPDRGSRERSPSVSAVPASIPSRGQVLPPQGCDEETADMMARLDKLQTWLILKCSRANGDREFLSAHQLIQDTRAFIVERLYAKVCDHSQWRFERHGRLCPCGKMMADFGD